MKLFSRQYSDGGPPLIILHGLFGNQANWAGHAKELANDYSVYAFDLRNHGKSDWSDEHSYPVLAEDVCETINELGLERVSMIGHSMGGKTAMYCALAYPELVDKLVVVDIAPVTYLSGEYMPLSAMQAVDLSELRSRQQAASIMAQYIDTEEIINFLLTNLQRNKEGEFSWRCNLKVIASHFDEIRSWPELENVFAGETLFVKGADSDYLQEKYRGEIALHFPNSALKIIDNAGHWVHSQKPKAFLKIVSGFLSAE